MDTTALTALINQWSPAARDTMHCASSLFHQIAQDRALGPLDESLKWGQPAWRPQKPRTGTTLRMWWQDATPDEMAVFVDCKTDLAARMSDLYPAFGENDLQRRMTFDLRQPFPEQALAHLAEMTFAYHLNKRQPA